ncbi:hypothetical protein OEA41_004963 [Lepraria neglecta]|uniref:DUF924 domain-containing protein n=1 Tax=Lepraria neglecta TaxID=209136 RepID=A0AAD9YYW1_9LECA|nr:hypothetical protein OEA41_004963 [Lepraria neglecta]
MDLSIDRIISFWFDPCYQVKRWFEKSDDLDNQIRVDFGDLVSQARTPALDSWTQNPRGTLAMLVLLDQFTRNIFRGSAEAFDGDAKAMDISVKAISKGFDREVEPMQQALFYLPLMHNESLLSQIATVSFYENYAQRCQSDSPAKSFATDSVGFAKNHRDVIAMFGRFPGRNKALGRTSTAEEVQYLKEHPSGF